MDLTFSKYWSLILESIESDGICIDDISDERKDFLKKKAKSLYNKDIGVYDAFEQLVELF